MLPEYKGDYKPLFTRSLETSFERVASHSFSFTGLHTVTSWFRSVFISSQVILNLRLSHVVQRKGVSKMSRR